MRKIRMVYMLGSLWLVLIFITLALLTACSSQPTPSSKSSTSMTPTTAPTTSTSTSAGGKSFVLKAVGAFPGNDPNNPVRAIGEIADLVKQRSNGQLQINWIGGPEAIAAANQPTALRSGNIDFLVGPSSYFQNLVPQFGAANLCQFSLADQQAKGINDQWNQLLNKSLNARFLGFVSNTQYYIFLNQTINNPKTDFKGLKIRSGVIYNSFIKALGAVSVTVSADDVYTALQTKIVDGAGWVPDQVFSNKAYEVLKFWIDVPFYHTATPASVNLDSFNAMPKNLQDILITASAEICAKDASFFDNNELGILKQMATDKGMKPITLSAEDAAWYTKTAYDSAWSDLEKTLSPADYTKFYNLVH